MRLSMHFERKMIPCLPCLLFFHGRSGDRAGLATQKKGRITFWSYYYGMWMYSIGMFHVSYDVVRLFLYIIYVRVRAKMSFDIWSFHTELCVFAFKMTYTYIYRICIYLQIYRLPYNPFYAESIIDLTFCPSFAYDILHIHIEG